MKNAILLLNEDVRAFAYAAARDALGDSAGHALHTYQILTVGESNAFLLFPCGIPLFDQTRSSLEATTLKALECNLGWCPLGYLLLKTRRFRMYVTRALCRILVGELPYILPVFG